MKFKALKWWQALLIVFSIILLGVGGALVYVHLTTGIGAKQVYPNDISFVIDQTSEDYNAQLSQLEKSENFKLSVGSLTEELTEKQLTLSFTKNFTEQADENGYISDGVITIPQKVNIGEEFEVKVNKAGQDVYSFLAEGETWNVGGNTTIYAITENKLLAPVNVNIAIDVPVYKTQVEMFDLTTQEILTPINGVYNITQGTNVRISTKFYPEKSQTLYSDNDSESARKKEYFLEVIEGGENFVLNKTEEGTYFSADGKLSSTAKIRSYTFKNATEQLKFYVDHAQETEDQRYNSAIEYLSRTGAPACISDSEIVIVQANVKTFSMSREESLKLTTNKLHRISVGSTQLFDANLGVSILDNQDKLVPAMIKNIAMRVLKQSGDVWQETDEVKIVGGDKLTVNDKNYTFINSKVLNLNNAYFELSSKLSNVNYKLEFALLLHDVEKETETNTEVFKEFENILELGLSFTESNETNISWLDNTNIEIIIDAESGAASQASENLARRISVPKENNYQKVVFFAEFEGLQENQIKEYISIKSLREYTINEQIHALAELESSELLVKKGIKNFEVRFAVVKTDAYGVAILENGNYVISQISSPILVNVIEAVSGLEKANAIKLVVKQDYKYSDEEKTFYVVPVGLGEIKLSITLDKQNADLFLAQAEEGRFEISAYDVDEDKELVNALEFTGLATKVESSVSGKFDILYSIKFKNTTLDVNKADKHVILKLRYEIGQKSLDLSATIPTDGEDGNDFAYVTVYNSQPANINLEDIESFNGAEVDHYQIEQSLNENGAFNDPVLQAISATGAAIESTITNQASFNEAIKDIRIVDKYNQDITTQANIEIRSLNPDVISVNENEIQIVKGSNGACVLNFSSSMATKSISFISSSEKMSKIMYLKDTEETQTKDRDISSDDLPDEYKSEETINLNEISIKKLGYSGNSITLANLIQFFVKADESEEEKPLNASTYYFSISPSAGLDNNAKLQLFGQKASGENSAVDGMLKAFSNETQIFGDEIGASTRITKLEIHYDFGQDFRLPLNVIGDGSPVNTILNLDILSNIKTVEKAFTSLSYGDGKENPASEGEYIGVYAKYGINLNNVIKVTKK